MEGKKGRHLDHNSARAPHTMTCGVWLSIQTLRIVQKLLCHCKVTYETSNAHLRLPVKAVGEVIRIEYPFWPAFETFSSIQILHA